MRTSFSIVAVLLGLSAVFTGCSSPAGDAGGASGQASPGEVPAGDSALGSVGLQLSLPAGLQIEVVEWSITGPNGASTVVQAGSAHTQSVGLTLLIANIPPGSGYRITISGAATNGGVTCTGSALFDVAPRSTTKVPVALACSVATSGAHVTLINGSSFDCAAWDNVSASPAETNVGSAVTLSATATGPSPGAISFAWSAPSGSFANATAANTTFTCTSPGPVDILLTVSDGPVPVGQSCDPTLSTRTVPVICDGVIAPVPASPHWAVTGLAALLAALGAIVLRGRRPSFRP